MTGSTAALRRNSRLTVGDRWPGLWVTWISAAQPVTAISLIDVDAGHGLAGEVFDLGNLAAQRVAVVGKSGTRLNAEQRNWPPAARALVTAIDTLTPNSHGRSSVNLVSTWHSSDLDFQIRG